jgi:hypothetical protein
MKKFNLLPASAITGAVLVVLVSISPPARAGGGAPTCSSKNGDVNADEQVDLSDAVAILGHLFLGSPTELAPNCDPPELSARVQELEAQLADCHQRIEELETQLADCRTGNSTGVPDTGDGRCSALLDDGTWVWWPCEGTNCPGQDAQYARGCSSQGRFIDNGDGTLLDNCTGLMWQKDMADVFGDGQSEETDRIDWCQSLSYCENLIFAGFDDWRLPNVRELQSIVDYGFSDPAIDDEVFGTSSSWHSYWSSTNDDDDPAQSWYVDFKSGFVFHDAKTFHFNVRAVRSGL